MGAKKSVSMTLIALAACTTAGSMAVSTNNAFGSAFDHQHITRDDCFSGSGTMGRSMGVRNSTRIFNAVWNRLGRNCAQLERLSQIIAETPLARPSTFGAFQACFYQGYVENLFDQLQGAYDRCGDRCFTAGSEMGKISAEGYCAASAAVGGLDDPGFIAQPPLPFCGENLVLGCKSEYVMDATSVIAGCEAYTEGAFATVFDDSVRQDCFVPTDVPIRDINRIATEAPSDPFNTLF